MPSRAPLQHLSLVAHPRRRPSARVGVARALGASEGAALLSQVADAVEAAKDVARAWRDAPRGVDRADALQRELRPLVFAGNCLWAAADAAQEREALIDLQRYAAVVIEALQAAKQDVGAALVFRAEHRLRAMMTVAGEATDPARAG